MEICAKFAKIGKARCTLFVGQHYMFVILDNTVPQTLIKKSLSHYSFHIFCLQYAVKLLLPVAGSYFFVKDSFFLIVFLSSSGITLLTTNCLILIVTLYSMHSFTFFFLRLFYICLRFTIFLSQLPASVCSYIIKQNVNTIFFFSSFWSSFKFFPYFLCYEFCTK